jgi:hypothetical protein
MSVICCTYVWELDNLTATEKIVLLKIADNAQDDGMGAFGSEKYMAARCGLSDRSIRNALRSLEEKGELITRHKQGRETSSGKTNAYTLCGYRSVMGLHPYLSTDSDYDKIRVFKSKAGERKGRNHVPPGTTFRPSPEPRSAHEGNHVPPEPSVEPSVEPSENSAGGSSSRDRAEPPTEVTPAPPALPPLGDSFDMPAERIKDSQARTKARPQTKRTGLHKYFDPTKLVEGFVPGGEGETPIEVYFERFKPAEHKLKAPQQDDLQRAVTDLERWRQIVIAWDNTGHNPANIGGMLDWYRDPSRLPSNRHRTHVNGSAPAAVKPITETTLKDWLLRTYHMDHLPGVMRATQKTETEIRNEYKQWRVANGLPPG